MDLIYRLSGREAADLNKEIVKTQNLLNERINEVDSLDSLNKNLQQRITDLDSLNISYASRIKTLEKAERYYIENESNYKNEIKLLKASKAEAMDAVKDATKKVSDAEKTVFNISQELATKNADLNDMILKVSQLDQRIKAMPLEVTKTKFGKKLESLKNKH